LGGRGSSGEGLRRRVHGEGRPAEVLVAGGATPARERRRGWAGEVQGGERNPFRGSIGAEEGRNGGSTELRRCPAMVARAGGLAGHARGAGARFIGGKEREGELGREQPGQGAKPGEDAGSARGAAAILVARAGEERGGVASSGAPEKVGWGNTRGAGAVLGGGATRGAARWPAPAYGVAVGTVQGSWR
jgi:hypothetical protein